MQVVCNGSCCLQLPVVKSYLLTTSYHIVDLKGRTISSWHRQA